MRFAIFQPKQKRIGFIGKEWFSASGGLGEDAVIEDDCVSAPSIWPKARFGQKGDGRAQPTWG